MGSIDALPLYVAGVCQAVFPDHKIEAKPEPETGELTMWVWAWHEGECEFELWTEDERTIRNLRSPFQVGFDKGEEVAAALKARLASGLPPETAPEETGDQEEEDDGMPS